MGNTTKQGKKVIVALTIGIVVLLLLLLAAHGYNARHAEVAIVDTVIMDQDTMLMPRPKEKKSSGISNDIYTVYKLFRVASAAYKVHQALNVSDEDLAEYMRESMKAEDAQNKVCGSTSPYTTRLKKITRGITTVDGKPLNFKVYYDTQTANAFASPDGSIRVYSKLMDMMSDEEILGILGHELGHLACKHSLKEYKAALLISATREGLLLDDGTIGDIAASQLGGVIEYMLNAKYSRDQESEADDYGFDYLVKHHRDPMAIANGLEKLQKLSSSGNQYSRYVSTLFSSHPDINNRVAHLKARARNMK